jgi:hypothetical protein
MIEMVNTSSFWLNSFPSANGVSSVLSPRAIVIGSTVEYSKHCQLEFGAYVQTHEEHDNSMTACTTGAIALCPTGNAQGGYYFYSLTSGRCLNHRRWTELPMPAEVIACVHTLDHQSADNGGDGLSFSNRNGTTEAPQTAEAPHSEDNDNRSEYDANDDAPIAGVYQHEVDDDASQEMEVVGDAIDEAHIAIEEEGREVQDENSEAEEGENQHEEENDNEECSDNEAAGLEEREQTVDMANGTATMTSGLVVHKIIVTYTQLLST